MKPHDKLRAWKSEPALDRVEGCLVMLYCHDFVSDAEKDRIAKRIKKWVQRHEAAAPSKR